MDDPADKSNPEVPTNPVTKQDSTDSEENLSKDISEVSSQSNSTPDDGSDLSTHSTHSSDNNSNGTGSSDKTRSDQESTGNEDLNMEHKTEGVDVKEQLLEVYQLKHEEHLQKIYLLEEKCNYLEKNKHDLEVKLESAVKEKDQAVKQRESTVMRFAVSEKNILEQKRLKELAEKKCKEVVRENEILQHKVSTMGSEKTRICQMLDNKCYELKTAQQELEHVKTDLSALETKLKWSQNSLKNEIELHKESQAKVEGLNAQLQDVADQVEKAKKEAQDSIKAFHNSQDNKAYVLEQQLKELQASLILHRHERDDRDQQSKNLQSELERLQGKQQEMLQENNDLSLKVQQLERDRLESQQRLSELRGCADQQRQDAANLNIRTVQLEQLRLQLKNEQEQLRASHEQMELLKQRNAELEADMEVCRVREAELLLFTQQLTDKNVRLQSEFTTMETKVQQLTCEQSILKRSLKEKETKIEILTSQLSEERSKYHEDSENLNKRLSEKCKICDALTQEVADQRGENSVIKRKLELSLREVTKELQHCRKKLEQHESNGISTSKSSSSTSLSTADRSNGTPSPPVSTEQVKTEILPKIIQPDGLLDRQTLIEHIVKLQRVSARKSEKIDFLEEHVNTLVAELQKKSHLLQSYALREQAGTMTSNTMDSNKANLAKMSGVMASVYSSRIADSNLTLELSLDINRKLQAVLEDALLKNITLKENVDTLGAEIDRLNKNMVKS